MVSTEPRVTVMDDDHHAFARQLVSADFSNETLHAQLGHRVKDERVLQGITSQLQQVAIAEYQALISQHGPGVMRTMADKVRAHVQRIAVMKAQEMIREHEHRLAIEEQRFRAQCEAREQQRHHELQQQRQQHTAMNSSNTMMVYQPSGFDDGPCAMDEDDDSDYYDDSIIISGQLMLECGNEQQQQQMVMIQGTQLVETHHFEQQTLERYTERQTTYHHGAIQQQCVQGHVQNGLCRAFLNRGRDQCGNERISNSPYCKQHDYNATKGVMSADEWQSSIYKIEKQRPRGFCLAWFKNGTLCKEQQVPRSPYCAKHDCSSQKGAPHNWLSN